MLSLQDLNVFLFFDLTLFLFSMQQPCYRFILPFRISRSNLRFGAVEAMLAKKQKEQQDLVNDKSPKVEGAPLSDVYLKCHGILVRTWFIKQTFFGIGF